MQRPINGSNTEKLQHRDGGEEPARSISFHDLASLPFRHQSRDILYHAIPATDLEVGDGSLVQRLPTNGDLG